MTEKATGYSWSSAPCVRCGEYMEGENHPCYWCGVPPADMFGSAVQWCKSCGGFICPHCGKCWCNVDSTASDALRFLRDRYCCNWLNFKLGVQPEDGGLLQMVPGFKKALDYCRERKGFA